MKIGNALAALCLILATPCFAGPEHKELAGRYHLNGVMEVGSVLELNEDGSYDWFLAYGSEDFVSTGTWKADATSVTLTAKKIESEPVPVTIKESAGWSSVAEYQFRSELAARESEKLCPSAEMADGIDTENMPRGQARVHAGGQDGDEPNVPKKCGLTETSIDRDIAPADWQGRQAFVVINAMTDLGISDVGIRVDYTNGKSVEGRTNERGIFLPIPQSAEDVRQVTISYGKSKLSPAVFPISRRGSLVAIFHFDYRSVAPPFSTMTLERSTQGLKPDGGVGGIYTRQNGQ